MRRKALVGGLMAAVLLLAGCTMSNQPKGELAVACATDLATCQALATAFQAKYQRVTATSTPVTDDEAVAALTAGKYDVWYGAGAAAVAAADQAGLLAEYLSPNAAPVPDSLKAATGHWTGVAVTPVAFCSNTMVLNQLGLPYPESWDELLAPGLVTQVVLGHPSTVEATYQSLWALGQIRGGDQALDYFKQLDHNVLLYAATAGDAVGLVGDGEVAATLAPTADCAAALADGKPVVVSYPKEGTGYSLQSLAYLTSATNQIAAQAYIDWLLGAEAQTLAAANGAGLPINGDAAVPEGQLKLKWITLADYDEQAAGIARAALVERFAAEVAPPS